MYAERDLLGCTDNSQAVGKGEGKVWAELQERNQTPLQHQVSESEGHCCMQVTDVYQKAAASEAKSRCPTLRSCLCVVFLPGRACGWMGPSHTQDQLQHSQREVIPKAHHKSDQ